MTSSAKCRLCGFKENVDYGICDSCFFKGVNCNQ